MFGANVCALAGVHAQIVFMSGMYRVPSGSYEMIQEVNVCFYPLRTTCRTHRALGHRIPNQANRDTEEFHRDPFCRTSCLRMDEDSRPNLAHSILLGCEPPGRRRDDKAFNRQPSTCHASGLLIDFSSPVVPWPANSAHVSNLDRKGTA
jgi:hypothetical protein